MVGDTRARQSRNRAHQRPAAGPGGSARSAAGDRGTVRGPMEEPVGMTATGQPGAGKPADGASAGENVEGVEAEGAERPGSEQTEEAPVWREDELSTSGEEGTTETTTPPPSTSRRFRRAHPGGCRTSSGHGRRTAVHRRSGREDLGRHHSGRVRDHRHLCRDLRLRRPFPTSPRPSRQSDGDSRRRSPG